MPSPLPLNLQNKVLYHLKQDAREADLQDREQILAICCLMCQDWCRIIQRELWETIKLNTDHRLRTFLESLSSTTHPIGAYVDKLSFVIPNHDDGHMPFLKKVLDYFSTKLPNLRRLGITRSYDSFDEFEEEEDPSPILHLEQFTALTELILSNLRFASFWDFHRLVIALPALSRLHLAGVGLRDQDSFQEPNGRTPSAPQNLIHISFTDSFGNWNLNPLWLWVVPFRARSERFPRSPYTPPLLTLHDAGIIMEYSKPWSRCEGYKCTSDWLYNEELQQCELITLSYCSEVHHVTGTTSGSFVHVIETIGETRETTCFQCTIHTSDSDIPQQGSLPSQLRREECVLSSAIHKSANYVPKIGARAAW